MIIYSPIKGKVVALETVNDPVFSEKMMGEGIAIIPEDSLVLSPVSGTVTSVFPTKHAFGLESEDGLELLIHIGLDTVKLNGEYFDAKVSQGDKVTVGDVLVSVDFSKVLEAGYDIVTPLIIIDHKGLDITYSNMNENVDFLDEVIVLK
ncbi:MAG: PTS glucose transporter subunit IIA [Erysipelothrix sp.]|nr:PTS glucose transporter subunit IIA [Erysipelothrix sp.]